MLLIPPSIFPFTLTPEWELRTVPMSPGGGIISVGQHSVKDKKYSLSFFISSLIQTK
jgi:hypothetical protein